MILFPFQHDVCNIFVHTTPKEPFSERTIKLMNTLRTHSEAISSLIDSLRRFINVMVYGT
jgi:hypothetical protein